MGEWYQWQGDTLILRLRLQPGASRNAVLGPWGEQSLRISVKARPVEGKANAELIAYIAECFGVHARAVELLGGAHSRDKRVAVHQPQRFPPEAGISSRA